MRRRRWPIVLAALVIVVGSVAFAVRHYTRPERLTAILVAQARSTLGADLATSGAATFGFFPNLSVALPNPTLKAHGVATVMVRADTLRAVVPWNFLWSNEVDIERIELVRPVLDIDALNAWLATRPASGAPVPDVRFSLRVDDGTITSGGKSIAQGLSLRFANSADLATWYSRLGATPTSLIPPLSGSADASMLQFGDTRLDDVHIKIADGVKEPTQSRRP